MNFYYKTIKKDWESADKRFKYRAGDEVMILQENNQYYTVALDVGIVGCIPNDYFDKYEIIYKDVGNKLKEIKETLEDEALKYQNELLKSSPYDSWLAGANYVIEQLAGNQ